MRGVCLVSGMRPNRIAAAVRRAAPLGALLLLSLLWAGQELQFDLLPQLAPDAITPVLLYWIESSFPCLIVAVVAGMAVRLRKEKWPRGQRFWNAIQVGLGMFVIPNMLQWIAIRGASQANEMAFLTLVPVFALVFEPYIGAQIPTSRPQNGEMDRPGLLAALACAAGILLIVPVYPAGYTEWASVALSLALTVTAAASVAAANCLAVREVDAQPLLPMTAVASGVATLSWLAAGVGWGLLHRNSLASGSSLVANHSSFLVLAPAWTAVVELAPLVLLFWLLRRMPASRMALRYVLAPWFGIVIGLILLRRAPEPRTWLGLVLMAAGAAWLLFVPRTEPDSTGVSLR
jgi:drug/metabolite transporter (DMT)-like permease